MVYSLLQYLFLIVLSEHFTTAANYVSNSFSVFRSWRSFYRVLALIKIFIPVINRLTGVSLILQVRKAKKMSPVQQRIHEVMGCGVMTVWPLTLCSLQPPIAFTLQIITAPLKPLSPSLGTAMEIRGREIEPGQRDAYRVDGRLPVEEDKWSITKRWKWAECGGGFKVWGWQVFKILLLLSTLFLSSCRVFVKVFLLAPYQIFLADWGFQILSRLTSFLTPNSTMIFMHREESPDSINFHSKLKTSFLKNIHKKTSNKLSSVLFKSISFI